MGRTTFFLLEQEQKAKENKKEVDWEEKIKQYHTSGGWYDLPGYEKSKRKEEAIELLKESDK